MESGYDGGSTPIIKPPMFWLLLEAGVAGLLLILIVAWTLPRKPRQSKKDDPTSPK
jgi:hypothetical protein